MPPQFGRDAQKDVAIPAATSPPKRGDFVAWSEVIAEWAVPGEEAKDIRRHAKQLASTTWQLASWLTHARNALRTDAELTSPGVVYEGSSDPSF